jgi:hypothetical protein
MEMRKEDIFDHQVATLVSMVQRLQKTGGKDKELEVRVRNFVSFELIGRGAPDVTARAMGELDDAEADLLNEMVHHCSQTFYRTDAVWSAFAVPVAVNWHMQHHRRYRTNCGCKDTLDELALGIRQCVGAQEVFIDKRIYSATDLCATSARNLQDHLQQLVIGAPRLTAPLKSISLHSSSEPPWRMAYFLGVEVGDLNSKRRLQEPGVQDAMQGYLHLGVDALTKPNPAMPKPVIFALGAHGETVCHAPLYLHDAIRFGQKAMRGYRLRQMLQEISKEETRVTIYYTFNPLAYAFDLLLSGKWLTFELHWKLYSQEFIDEFVGDVKVVMSAEADSVECTLVCLEFEEFQATRAETAVACYRRKKT